MPRIPEELIERLKREVSIVELVQASGVELVRQGKEWVGVCPHHTESEASLFVNPDKGSWHCFGCNRGGSVLDWRMQTAKLGFREAFESLAAEHFAGESAEPPATAVLPLPLPDVDALLAASDAEVGEWIVDLYHQAAKSQAKPREYLASRGLEHPQLLERFRIGFADRTLGLRLPDGNTKRGEALRSRLQRLGIFRQNGREHLNGRVVVPLFSLEGELLQLYGRTVTPNLRFGTPKHLYLERPQNGIVNPEAFEGEELVLCEAPLDALTFWSAGFRNVTTTCGAHSHQPLLFEAMRRGRTKRVLVAFDRDDAGDSGAKSIAEKLNAQGIACWRVLFPKGMDANQYAQKVHPVANALDLVLRNAQRLCPQSYWGMGEEQPPAVPLPEIHEEETKAAETETAAKEEAAAFPLAAASQPPEVHAVPPVVLGEPIPAPQHSLLPSSPSPDVAAEVKPHEVVVELGDRRYRARGVEKNLSYDAMRVSLVASRGEGLHVDTLDLRSAKQRVAFAKQAATELGMREEILARDLGKVLLKLEELQDQAIQKALEPKETKPQMTSQEREAAMTLLRDPKLLERIVDDLERVGIVGETVNKLVCYLVTVSRKQAKPLGVVIQSSSAAGKSALMRAVLELVPEEERIAYSAMTGQSLFYMSEKDLKHKVLAIAEEEGAEKASYALKLLLSEGELSIASTGKDPQSGKLVTHEYKVEGPVAVLSTTTSIEVDEELLNRCLVLTVDEEREQTRAIHRAQRESETLEGQVARRRRPAIVKLHQNAQRLLRPLAIVNPFAGDLSYPDAASRTRRDHEKYLSLIRAVALLHQHQRPTKTTTVDGEVVEYLEVTATDIASANRLARQVLGRALDELPPQTRRLLYAVDHFVRIKAEELAIARSDVRFSRRDLRDFTGWNHSQLAVHLSRLETLEYLIVHRGLRGQSFVYELAYEAQPGADRVVLAGLIDVSGHDDDGHLPAFLDHLPGFGDQLPGFESELPGPIRPQSGALPGGVRGGEAPASIRVLRRFDGRFAEKRTLGSRRSRARRTRTAS
ncbi:MAG: CHC2 zinc finger domain-containing protein [Woeseiaceae bacterium]